MNAPVRRRVLPALVLSAGLVPAVLPAGTFTASPFTGDADSGVSAGLTYTAIADFNGSGATTVNGVSFANTGTSGGNYNLSIAGANFAGFGNTVTGSANAVVSNFTYTGNGSGNASLTLSGLTPGQSYVTSWLNAGFGTAGNRQVNITPSDTGVPFLFDENYTGNGNGNVLRYAFTATGNSITYNFDALSDGDSFHHYAMTNSVADPGFLSTPTVAAATGAGPFAPFTPSNTDLLQSSLAGVSSSGNFAQEGTGGVPILNNGQFAVTGIGGNNPELATAENNSLVTFTLNTIASPLGYDITGVDTYGGWNDAGRDRQSLKISYSLVGSATFTYIGGFDFDPVAAGTPSAVRAQFPLSLTGVDELRIEFFGNQENGYAGIGEIDVFGSATIPEPATPVVALLSGLLCLRRRRT